MLEDRPEYSLYRPDDLKAEWMWIETMKIPLSIAIKSEEWQEAVKNRAPDLTLAEYLAVRFVALGLPIPKRVKKAVLDEAPESSKKTLNDWNKKLLVPGKHLVYRLDDPEIKEALRAIAASVVSKYLDTKDESVMHNLTMTLSNVSWDFSLFDSTQKLVTNYVMKGV